MPQELDTDGLLVKRPLFGCKPALCAIACRSMPSREGCTGGSLGLEDRTAQTQWTTSPLLGRSGSAGLLLGQVGSFTHPMQEH
jgi:hypothetical protein